MLTLSHSKELGSSTVFPYLVEQLIDDELPGVRSDRYDRQIVAYFAQTDVAAIEAFFAEYFGPAFKELPVNLRAFHRMYEIY